jgi:uncharacterized protein (TIGR02996 family)
MSDEPDKNLFEEMIRADRYDRVTRLIFADWLEEHGHDDEAVVQRSWTIEKQLAEDWLTGYAQEHNLAYADLIRAAHHFLDTGETNYVGVEVANVLFDPSRREEFWRRFETATGRDPHGAVGDVHRLNDVEDYGDPCGMCPGHEDYQEEERPPADPFDDEFYNERGW